MRTFFNIITTLLFITWVISLFVFDGSGEVHLLLFFAIISLIVN